MEGEYRSEFESTENTPQLKPNRHAMGWLCEDFG